MVKEKYIIIYFSKLIQKLINPNEVLPDYYELQSKANIGLKHAVKLLEIN